MSPKTEQIQIRVTPAEKSALKRLARASGLGISGYVLARALPDARLRFVEILRALGRDDDHRYALAELNDLLAGLTPARFADAVAVAPPEIRELSPFLANYVAAMVEQTAARLKVAPPAWVRDVAPLETPHFATPLAGLRLHLLRSAPVVFKRRNIFVDATVGERV